MARDEDTDNASFGNGQSQRPLVARQGSDSHSETHHQRPKQHSQKQRHVGGRLHHRVPSAKALHKQHGHASNAPSTAAKLNHRRIASPTNETPQEQEQAHSHRPKIHRRAASEVKLPRQLSGANLQKSASQTSLKRNRSSVEVGSRTKSSDKLKHSPSGTKLGHRPKSSKTQVHFDLGSEEEVEEEWVDASGSNSPLQSRNSLQSSAHSSLRPASSATDSRPVTPLESLRPPPSPAESERANHQAYLTTRILQRTPSVVAPTKMTVDMAQATPSRQASPESALRDTPSTSQNTPSTAAGNNKEGLTSRFVHTPGSGQASEASSFYPPNGSAPRRSGELPTRPKSMADLSKPQETTDTTKRVIDKVDSALVPKPARRNAPGAETSRIQQKLNLQRASSAIEPGQPVPGGGVVSASPLIGVGGPNYDGGHRSDPRVGKLLERAGMEYLVVRRYQNPIARSLRRIDHVPSLGKRRGIPRPNTATNNGKSPRAGPAIRHTRNVSMPDQRRPVTPKKASIKTNGTGSSYEEDSRLHEQLSGIGLVGEEENATVTLLRNLWEKPLELSASVD